MRHVFVLSLLLSCASLPLMANTEAVATPEECSKEMVLAYFPAPFVKETLKKFGVPEDKAEAISTTLASKDGQIIQMVEEKAAAMETNPLRDPQARQAAVKLFRDTLFQVFASVVKENGITDEQKIQQMLDDIQRQKAERFAKCMRSYVAPDQDKAQEKIQDKK